MAAGSAASHNPFVDPLQDADNLPCADFGLLGPLKRSAEYSGIRKRVADPKPIDAWRLEMIHYFVFELRPEAEDASTPYALFTMRWEDHAPMSAIIITPNAEEKQAEMIDLRRPGVIQTLPLSH